VSSGRGAGWALGSPFARSGLIARARSAGASDIGIHRTVARYRATPRTLRRLAGASLLLPALALVGCRQDMHDQPKLKPLAESDFFPDHRGARPRVPGTVARGHLREDDALNTGKVNGAPVETLPVPLTEELVRRGRERFETFCSPCHGRTGRGDGMVAQRGLKKPPSYHVDRLRAMPVGYFFDVMTNGFGAMSDYSAQIGIEERWAVAAYVRALQISEDARLADVPADHRGDLDAAEAPKHE
jgi:mono/diheme cytochrome c family protein